MRRFTNLSGLTVILLSAQLSLMPAWAGVYDAAADFSSTSNPNGVWSYGWEASTGATFILDTDHLDSGTISSWRGDIAGDGNPGVYRNDTGAAVSLGTVVFPPDTALLFHPGPGGQNAVVRFTAPATGSYVVQAGFTGQDFVGGTTTDVHVLDNNVSIFNGAVNGYGNFTGLSPDTLFLTAGDTIDFTVGYGNNGTFLYDSTRLDATITTAGVPDGGSTLGLLSFGLLGLGLLRRK